MQVYIIHYEWTSGSILDSIDQILLGKFILNNINIH